MKALVVEDEDLVRELLASVVAREFDFQEVVEAGDGEEAWDLYQQHAFDFVVLDLVLPKLDGLTPLLWASVQCAAVDRRGYLDP